MAILSDLVEALANLTEIPEATIFAYGRFARERGLIAQKGRGRGAAKMELEDAVNLLIALGGTAVTREAGDAIRRYRPMPGTIYQGHAETVSPTEILKWLAPLGFTLTGKDEASEYNLGASLGDFLQFLIAEAISGGLVSFMQSITTWLLDHRGVRILGKKIIGKDLGITITFARTAPQVDVEFLRHWGGNTTNKVFQISFF